MWQLKIADVQLKIANVAVETSFRSSQNLHFSITKQTHHHRLSFSLSLFSFGRGVARPSLLVFSLFDLYR
jgi:hypothetical protein